MGESSVNLQRTAELLERTTAGFTPAQWSAAPAGKWNSAQILEHLRLTYDRSRKAFDRLLAAREATAGRRNLRQSFLAWYFLTFANTGFGAEAPEQVRPGPSPDGPASLAAALATLRELGPRSEEMLERFGPKRVLLHPYFGPMSADEMARFHWAHARHHMRQVRARSGAPVRR